MGMSLAGNLALVTCREPLRISLINSISEVLKNIWNKGSEIKSDAIVKEIVVSNLDIACKIIESKVKEYCKEKLENDTIDKKPVYPDDTTKELPLDLRETKELKNKVYD
jgi:CCR4-NOT transcription complex subunit 1